jgi:hypothetical protein
VSPGLASKLAFGQQPTTTKVNQIISPAVTVRVLDAFGNLETGDSVRSVSVAIGTNPTGGTLNGTTTVADSGGIATFSTLSINKVGKGYTLVGSSSGLTSVTSVSFNITRGGKAAALSQPLLVSAGTPGPSARALGLGFLQTSILPGSGGTPASESMSRAEASPRAASTLGASRVDRFFSSGGETAEVLQKDLGLGNVWADILGNTNEW